MRSILGSAFATAVLLGMAAAPADAQMNYSNSYTFIQAVKERDGDKVTDLISAAGSTVINTREQSTGNGALHMVVRDRDLSWLSFLLSKGAKADLQNSSGDTPLSLAAQVGWVEGAELLLRRTTNVDMVNGRGETPLILAVQRRDVAMVRLLLSRGANPKRTDNVAGYSAIDYAKRDGRAATIVKMLEAPATKPAREVAGPKL